MNTWTHLAATYNGNVLALYVNGVQAGQLLIAGSLTASTSPLRIGGNNVWGEWFEGDIDEVRVYNRALAASRDPGRHEHLDLESGCVAPSAPGVLSAVGGLSSASLSWGAATRQRGCGALQRAPRRRVRGSRPRWRTGSRSRRGRATPTRGWRPGRTTTGSRPRTLPAMSARSRTRPRRRSATRSRPSAPGTLSAVGSVGKATLSWAAATDNVGVLRYNVHRGTSAGFTASAGNRIAQPSTPGYIDTTSARQLLLQGHRRGRGRQHRPRLERGHRDRNAPTRPRPSAPSGADRTGDRRDRQPQLDRLHRRRRRPPLQRPPRQQRRLHPQRRQPDRATDRHQLRRQRPRDRQLLLQGHRRRRRRQHQRRLQRGQPPPSPTPPRPASPAPSPPPPAAARSTSPGAPPPTTSASAATTSTAAPRSGFTPSTANRIAQPTGLSYSDTNLAPGTYFYKLTAEDAAGNIGPLSNTATATVADTTPPSTPTLTANGGAGQTTLSWTTATDNVAVTRYNLHRSTTQRLHPQHRQPNRATHHHQLHRHRPQRRHLLLQAHRRRRRRQPQHPLKPSHQHRHRTHPSPASSPPTASTPAPAPPSPTNPAPATTAPSPTPPGPARHRQIRQRPHLQRHQRHRHHPRHQLARPHHRHDPRSLGPPHQPRDELADRAPQGSDAARCRTRSTPTAATPGRWCRPASSSAAASGSPAERPRSRSTPGRTSRRRTTARRCGSSSTACRPGSWRSAARSPPRPARCKIGGNTIWGEYFQGDIDEVRIYNRALSRHRDPGRHEHLDQRAGHDRRRARPGTLTATGGLGQIAPRAGARRPTTSASRATTCTAARAPGSRPRWRTGSRSRPGRATPTRASRPAPTTTWSPPRTSPATSARPGTRRARPPPPTRRRRRSPITAPASGATVSATVSVTANASRQRHASPASSSRSTARTSAPRTRSAPYSVSWDTFAAGNGPHTLDGGRTRRRRQHDHVRERRR